jgi:hypothetical protein
MQGGGGAVSAPVARGIVAAWDMNGQLNPSLAMTRYMLAQYEDMSEHGETAKANQMAFEIVQRMSLEAAKFGQRAAARLRQGDVRGAAKDIQLGHSWAPDRRDMHLSGDGRFFMTDSMTGKRVTPAYYVTPQSLLAAAYGLQDGSGVWNALLARAQEATKTDDPKKAVDLENAMLRGELLRGSIQKQKQKAAGVGADPDPGMTNFRRIQASHAGNASGGGGGGLRPSAEDTKVVYVQPEEEDPGMRIALGTE